MDKRLAEAIVAAAKNIRYRPIVPGIRSDYFVVMKIYSSGVMAITLGINS